jgi:hypothetical protein
MAGPASFERGERYACDPQGEETEVRRQRAFSHRGSQPPEKGTVDLRSHLDLILECAEGDDLFEGKLAPLAAKAAARAADLEPYRQAIEAAIVVNDFVDYRSSNGR